MNWITVAGAAGALLVVLLKGLFGTDRALTVRAVEVPGTPLGPRLAARLRSLWHR